MPLLSIFEYRSPSGTNLPTHRVGSVCVAGFPYVGEVWKGLERPTGDFEVGVGAEGCRRNGLNDDKAK